jgi:hypothetical protein
MKTRRSFSLSIDSFHERQAVRPERIRASEQIHFANTCRRLLTPLSIEESRRGVGRLLFVVLSQQTVTTYADRVAGDPDRKQLLFLNVAVDRPLIDIDDPRRPGNPDDFDVFPAARAPDFVAAHDGRL